MAISIPSVQNGFSTADIVLEQKILCEKNLETIRNHAKVRKEREVNDEINRRLRLANDFLGMSGSRKLGCLYHEDGVGNSGVCEHVIPMSVLASLYHEGTSFEELVLYPIARISKESDSYLTRLGFGRGGHDLQYPFKRYIEANICIKTHKGSAIDLEKWSMSNHWELVFETDELKDFLCAVELEA